MIDILLDAFLLSAVLLGIHAYFGREIIRRSVIFTDLAIAQGAGVGVSLSILLHREDLSAYLSLTFALLAGFLVYLSERKGEYKEALIGLVYAFFISLGFLILSRSPHGAENFLRLTASDVLFTPRDEVITTALLYIFLGTLLYLKDRYITGKANDLIFYILFAVTVSSSIRLTGVLVVFSLLLAPALLSLLLKRGLLFAWIYGTVLNIIAILVSYQWDLPTGFSIVFFQSLITFLTVIIFK